MANNSTVTKLLQVSEEAAPAVQIPIIVGNEVFVLTQQDIRRVEDVRVFSYNRLACNGQMCPMPSQWHTNALGNQVNSSLMAAAQLFTLQGLGSQSQQPGTQGSVNTDHDMQKCPSRAVANVSKQLSWSKRSMSSSPYPMCYSVATSTSGLQAQTSDIGCRQKLGGRKDCSCQTCIKTTSQACNTEPRFQTNSQPINTSPIKSQSGIFKNVQSNDSLVSDISCISPEELCACEELFAKERQQQVVAREERSRRGSKSAPERSRIRRSKSKTWNPQITVENERYAEQQAKKRQLKEDKQQQRQLLDVEQQPSQARYGHSKHR